MMKHIRHTAIVCAALFLLVGSARAADDKAITSMPGYVDFAALDKIGEEAKVEVNLKGPMLNLVAKFAGDDDPDLRDMLSDLKLVRVRVYNLTPEIEKAFMSAGSETISRLDKSGWERIVRVREDDERVDIYFKPSAQAEWIDGVLIIAVDTEAVFVNIVGTIRPEDVARISDHLDINGIDLDSDDGTKIKFQSKTKTRSGS